MPLFTRIALLLSSTLLSGCGGELARDDHDAAVGDAGPRFSADGGVPPSSEASSANPPLPGSFTVGESGGCFLLSGGRVGCFPLPNVDAPDTRPSYDVTLAPVPGVLGATQLVGDALICARLMDGTVTCWESNPVVQPPQTVAGLDHVTKLDVGGPPCALRDDGSVWCWGWNGEGNLGRGNVCPPTNPDCDTTNHPPGPVVTIANATDVAVAMDHACVVIAGGAVYCWGRVGVGDTVSYPVDHTVPIDVAAAHGARALALTSTETTATLDNGFVVFGHPTAAEAPDAPAPVLESRLMGEEVFGNHADTFCRKRPSLPVHCKGGIASYSPSEYDVPGTETATDVSLGMSVGCARLSTNDLVCWGKQYFSAPTHVHID